MTLKGILTTLAFGLLLSPDVTAQEGGTTRLVVRSVPGGAQVVLKGEATVTGITPTAFRYPFVGNYRLKVSKHGFEDYHTHLVFDPAKQLEVDVKLTPKTRYRAAVRSLFFPGWGQKYADKNTKAFMFVFLAAGAASAYLIADHNFDINFEKYEDRLAEFDFALANGADREELEFRQERLTRAQEKAFDAEDVRRVTIGAVAAVWGLSIVDALLFTPEGKSTFTVKGLTVSPTSDNGGVGLTLSHNF